MKPESIINTETQQSHKIGTLHLQFPITQDSYIFPNDGTRLIIGHTYDWEGRNMKFLVISEDDNRFRIRVV